MNTRFAKDMLSKLISQMLIFLQIGEHMEVK